jgi:peptidoglycan hydrolase-like protein with peptidoglycan-binding domain
VTNVTKNWTGNWLKFIGGSGDLKLNFSSLKNLTFQVPYIVEDSAGSYGVKFLSLDKSGKGDINISKFGSDYRSLIIVPSLQSMSYKAEGAETSYPFTYAIFITGNQPIEDQALIQKLMDQISYLKAQIAAIQGDGGGSGVCSSLGSNLSMGMKNDNVKCLQEFLKGQGSDIYPEGLVTGVFGNLTRLAVIRFQEKYAADILTPVGLSKGSGYVGERTKNKINQLLNGS